MGLISKSALAPLIFATLTGWIHGDETHRTKSSYFK
jgi:hypothetical protein